MSKRAQEDITDIFNRRVEGGETLQAIGNDYKVSKERIRQIVAKEKFRRSRINLHNWDGLTII